MQLDNKYTTVSHHSDQSCSALLPHSSRKARCPKDGVTNSGKNVGKVELLHTVGGKGIIAAPVEKSRIFFTSWKRTHHRI